MIVRESNVYCSDGSRAECLGRLAVVQNHAMFRQVRLLSARVAAETSLRQLYFGCAHPACL
jgi:hypothetical protein